MITVTEGDTKMNVFWLEPMRLAVQSTHLACRQCQLMAQLALYLPWRLWAPTRREDHGR